MSDAMGPLTFGKKEEQIFLGREIAQHQDYSEDTALKIDQEVKRFVTDNYDRAHDAPHRAQAARCSTIADALLAREMLDADQVRRLAAGLPLDEPPPAAAGAAAGRRASRPRRRSAPPIVPPLPQAASRRNSRTRDSIAGSQSHGPLAQTCVSELVDSRRAFVAPAPLHRPAARRARLVLGERTLVMGVINVTPDSFADGGPLLDAGARRRGGAADGRARAPTSSTSAASRPGRAPQPVDGAEERAPGAAGRSRHWPAGVRCRFPSTPTRRDVADAALAAGADHRQRRQRPALRARRSPASWPRARRGARADAHARPAAATCTQQAVLRRRGRRSARRAARERGASRSAPASRAERIIVDPGLGFAKRAGAQLWCAGALSDASAALGPPAAGRSVAQVVPARARSAAGRPPERDWATAAAVTAAVLAGAHIVRVHAVAEMVQVVRVADGDTAG